MFTFFKRIIWLVIEFYRDTWKVFLSLSGAFALVFATVVVGLQNQLYMPIIAIPLALLTLGCFVIGVILWIKCYREARKQEYKKNHPYPWEVA